MGLLSDTPTQPILTDNPAEAARWLKAGHLVIFPTETVYGVGANSLDAASVAQIFAAKRRPRDNPLIVHVAAPDDISLVARTVTPAAAKLIRIFFPGPLTLILPRHPAIPVEVTGGLDTVAVRMPSLPVTQAFLDAAGVPVAAPSANLSGRPSATTWVAAQDDLGGHVACVLRGPPAEVGLESTVIDCTCDPPTLLRPGAITVETLRSVAPALVSRPSDVRRSPGMCYRHYAPRARVVIVADSDHIEPYADAGFIGLTNPSRPFATQCIADDLEAYARELFSFFRTCEAYDVETIYCQAVPETGLGRALMDRLRRAATGGP